MKVVDDVLFAGETDDVNRIVQAIETCYKRHTIVRSPGKLFFFGLQIEREDNFDIIIDANHKLNALEAFLISRARRKDGNDRLNAIEQKVFNSLNSFFGWLHISASPL